MYCSTLTGKEIKKGLGSSPFVRRNKKREQNHDELFGDISSMYGSRNRIECYDLVLSFDGHDLIDSYENDKELIVLEWHYNNSDSPSGSLYIRGDKWKGALIKVALNNVEAVRGHDVFEGDNPLASSDIEMACEVAKWMIAKGLNAGAGIAYKGVTRKDYQPIPRSAKPSLTELFDDMNNI